MKKRLAIQLVLALAVCAMIAVFDRAVVALVGAALCLAIFGGLALRGISERRDGPEAIAFNNDHELDAPTRQEAAFNPRNPAFPMHYPPADRD